MPTAPDLIRRLRTAGSDLPDYLVADIKALGHQATPLLLGVLEDATQGDAAPDVCEDCGVLHDGEWPRFHAVDILTDLREPDAIDVMLRLLASTRPEEPIHDKIVERLPDFGDVALEPLLAALEQTKKGSETVESLCCVLAALGVHDERILDALLDFLAVFPRAGAMYLSDYGDPAACPALLAVITGAKPDIEDASARLEFLDIVDAYASLGGELPPAEKARLDAWLGGEI